ncbi:MAG: FadR family transcriptional regulator [Clostridia bacterium]|nr:FadR family transcriptional regulator [Clostridia bacterium]
MIVHQIEEMMLTAELRPGDRLPPERELAQSFGVSRVTIRQAITVLKSKGLLEVRAGEGTYATERSHHLVVAALAAELGSLRDQVVEPIEVRKLLEPQIARLAAERATEEDVEELERIIAAQQVKFEAGEAFVDEDTAFHRRIATAARNRMLLSVVDSTWEMLRTSRALSLSTTEGARLSLAGHREIHEAIRAHRPDEAQLAMARHIDTVSALILSQYGTAGGGKGAVVEGSGSHGS